MRKSVKQHIIIPMINLKTIKRVLFLFLSLFLFIIFLFGVISVVRFFTPKSSYNFSANPRTVIKQIRDLNRLETAQFTIEKVIDAGTNKSTFQQFLFGDSILLIAQGEVIAGVDLSKLSDNDISISGSTVRLILPPSEILITTINNDQTRVYDRKLGVLTKGDKDLEAKAREKAESLIRQAACDGHILDQASVNARNQITALLKSLGFDTVIITSPQGSC